MPTYIETPADFAEQAHRPTSELARHYGVHPATVRTFRRRLGLPQFQPNHLPKPLMQMPDDFHEIAPTLGCHKLARHYRVADKTARRWLYESGLNRPFHKVIPEDFEGVAPTLTVPEAQARWGMSFQTIYRWEKVKGIKCKRIAGQAEMIRKAKVRAANPPKAAKEKPVDFVRADPPPRKVHKARATGLRDHGPLRDMTRAGQAADFLRKLDAVRRCDAKGAFSLTGEHWHFRGRLYDAAGIIERAERAGFDPDAWMRIAA